MHLRFPAGIEFQQGRRFENAQASDFERIEYSDDVRVESGHHRREKRQVWAVSISQIGDLYKQTQWSG